MKRVLVQSGYRDENWRNSVQLSSSQLPSSLFNQTPWHKPLLQQVAKTLCSICQNYLFYYDYFNKVSLKPTLSISRINNPLLKYNTSLFVVSWFNILSINLNDRLYENICNNAPWYLFCGICHVTAIKFSKITLILFYLPHVIIWHLRG